MKRSMFTQSFSIFGYPLTFLVGLSQPNITPEIQFKALGLYVIASGPAFILLGVFLRGVERIEHAITLAGRRPE